MAKWYSVLRSPVRLRILRILGERGPTPFKELRRELKLGVGTIYYHLSVMSDLIRQDEKKRYCLNERGLRVFSALRDGTITIVVREPGPLERFLRALLLSPLFRLACDNPRLGLPLATLVLALGGYGAARAELMPILMFYARTSTYGPYCLFFHYLAQWALVALACEALCLAFYRRRGAELELLIAVSLANLPLAIFPYAYLVLPYGVALKLLTVLQSWTALLICSAVSIGKGIRLDRALPVGLALLCINVVLLAFLGLLTF